MRRDKDYFGEFQYRGKDKPVYWLDEEESASIATKTDVDETVKEAVEWARRKLKGKKFRVHVYRN